MDFPITLVTNVSVSEAGAGIGEFNTSNIGLFTHEVYAASFGLAGYKIYTSASDVLKDFGSASATYQMAASIFAQKPNILAGGGQLIVIPMLAEQRTLSPSAAPASGSFVLSYGGTPTAAINWNDTIGAIQGKVRAIPALANALVTGSVAGGLTIQFNGIYGTPGALTVGTNTLQTSGAVAVTLTAAVSFDGELSEDAIARTQGLVQYFGVLFSKIQAQADSSAGATLVQGLNKIQFVASNVAADLEVGGRLDLLRSGSLDQSRGLYYGGTDIQALCFAAAYAGRALSVDFTGSNTTFTMHLKDLAGQNPDGSLDSVALAKAQAAGADVYISIQGVAKTFTSGKNSFFDRVYNRQAYVGALLVAYFNTLAQADTKITQTDSGMRVIKKSLRGVCDQYVTNQYVAPGEWTSPDTFGNQEDFLLNVSQRGYYIYIAPVASQSQADREARVAPLAQIAIKEAGAVHSGNTIVNINA